MIRLFQSTDNIFSSNGDKIIIPKKAIIHKEDNGSFFLELETDLSYIDDFASNKILVCNTPQGNQAFRIRDITATRRKISIEAKHVYYDSEDLLIKDSYVVDKSCNDALDHLNSATDTTSPFTTLSDVTTINSYRCVRRSLKEAIDLVLSRWGGHLVRDNFTIKIMDSIGQDNDVVVRYAKNLKDITVDYDWTNVVTKLMPVGKDGFLLPEEYVTSTTQYDIPYTKAVSFDQDINEDNYKDENGVLDEEAYENALEEDLRQQAQNYVDINCIPKVNYKLSANLEKISDIGDTIQVKDERLGVDIITNVISYEYDAILEKYLEIEFGNFTKQLNELIPSMAAETDKKVVEATNNLRVTLGDEIDQATATIMSALGSSYVIYEGDKILVVDTLPKENATNVIMINNGGIGFSQSGITGPFQSAWTIDNVLNMEQINVIGLSADMIKSGTLKLGSIQNQNGILEVYDEANSLIAELNKDGLKMYGVDGSYIVMNTSVGFSGYNRNGERIYWVDGEEFHQKKSVVEEEITLCGKLRYIPIQRYEDTYGANLFDYDNKVYGLLYSSGGIARCYKTTGYGHVYMVAITPNKLYRISKTLTTDHFQAAYTDRDITYINNLGNGGAFTVYGMIDGDGVGEILITPTHPSYTMQTLLIWCGTNSSSIASDLKVQEITRTLVNDGIGLVPVAGGDN